MKKIMIMFMLLLITVLSTPIAAFSKDSNKSDRADEVNFLIDNTILLRKENFARFQELEKQMEVCQVKKRKVACLVIYLPAAATLSLLAIPVAPLAPAISYIASTIGAFGSLSVLETIPLARGSDDTIGTSIIFHDYKARAEKRLSQYEETLKAFNDDGCSPGKVCRAQDKFINSLTRLFFDDPASAFNFIENDRSLFMKILEKDSYALEHLKHYNKVLATDPEIYSEYALKTLASASSKKYFRNLAQYIALKKSLKENLKLSKDDLPKNRKVEKTIKKEKSSSNF